MKYILQLCLCLSIPLSIQAQAILEHTYPTTDLHRIHWTFGGEHYWFSNDSLKEIKVYSAQHQLQKTIRYPSVLNSQVRLLKSEQAVTQTHINGDNLLEMLWYIKDTISKKEQLQIKNERDSLLFMIATRPHLVYFSEIEGLPTKLLIATNENGYRTTVYNVPNIRLDTVYLNAYYLRRKKFGYAGEKYFYKQSSTKRVEIFNANHSYWKSVRLDWFPSISLSDIDPYLDADDNVFAKDSLVEVTFSYWSSDDPRYGIIQEGNYLPLYKSSYPFKVDLQNGLEPKFLGQIYRGTNLDDYFKIYYLPNFRVEKQSIFPINRVLLRKYGETLTIISPYDYIALFYNNSQNINTINLNIPRSNYLVRPYSIVQQEGYPIVSDTIINKDTLIDVIYATYKYLNNNKLYTTKIINEKGIIYNSIDSTRYFAVNQSPTLSPKLITKTGNDKPYNTKVWRFNTTTPIRETPSVLEAKIYPNPFSKSITIETQENTVFPLNIRLMNALGEVVLATKTDQSKTDLALPNLAKGVYFLELSDNNKRTVREIVKMDF